MGVALQAQMVREPRLMNDAMATSNDDPTLRYRDYRVSIVDLTVPGGRHPSRHFVHIHCDTFGACVAPSSAPSEDSRNPHAGEGNTGKEESNRRKSQTMKTHQDESAPSVTYPITTPAARRYRR